MDRAAFKTEGLKLCNSPEPELTTSQQTLVLNPVTALAHITLGGSREGPYLLAAEGSWLKIYSTDPYDVCGEPEACCKVFTSQVIHGIAVQKEPTTGERWLIIWGGRSYIFVSVADIENVVKEGGDDQGLTTGERLASDWIFDAAFSPSLDSTSSNPPSCVLITAHNVAMHISGFDNEQPCVKTFSSASRSILYSAHIVWTSATSILVAAGTVFGDIEVLTWSMGSPDNSESGKIITTFTGHEGSIFGVKISPEILKPNGQVGRVLASCSDDRTIRLWELCSSSTERSISAEGFDAQLPETGFGEKTRADDTGPNASSHCIGKVMGHASRIWHVEFLTGKTPEESEYTPFNLLSFGEDATVQRWEVSGWTQTIAGHVTAAGPQEVATELGNAVISHMKTFSQHTGKHIWSCSKLDLADGCSTIATGGADGAIYSVDVSLQGLPTTHGLSASSILRSRSTIFTPEEIIGQFPNFIEEPLAIAEEPAGDSATAASDATSLERRKKKKKVKKVPPPKEDTFSKYAYVGKSGRGRLILTTTFGKIILGPERHDTEPLGTNGWTQLSLPAGCENDLRSYSVVASLNKEGCVLAGSSGKIFHYSPGSQIEKIADLGCKTAALFYLPSSPRGLPGTSILATTLGQSQATIIHISSTAHIMEASEIKIDLPANFVVTSAGRVGPKADFLVLGSRNGQIAMYRLHGADSVSKLDLEVDGRFVCKDAITSVIPTPTYYENDPIRFVITARNGNYATFALVDEHSTDESVVLSLWNEARLSFGPMIEGAQFAPEELFISGFRGDCFVVWNESSQQEVLNVKCGGAHRNYAFAGRYEYAFAYTKASQLCIFEQPGQITNIKPGGHGREIKATAVSEDQRFIATAAEDTNITIWTYRDSHNRIKNTLAHEAVLRKHSAGIQHLQWSEASGDAKYLFSAGGYEEFFVWAVNGTESGSVGVICEGTLTDLSEERDLRIMSFHVIAVGGEEGEENIYMVAIAFSDSTIRCYWYSRSRGFEKLAQGRYTSSCLTQIHVMPMPTGDTMVLTGSTDGQLQLWEFGDEDSNGSVELVMTHRAKVHQSTILSFDILPIGPLDFIVATGGDDNAVALSCLGPKGFGLRMITPSAHAAAVNGLTFVAHSSNTAQNAGTFRFCTVGGDQKVKKWTIAVTAEMNETRLSIKDLAWQELTEDEEVPTTVSDAAGIVTFGSGCHHHKHCLVYGNGIEIFEV